MLDALCGRDVHYGGASTASNSVSEQERELAREALCEFVRADYEACSAILEKLETLRPQDLKVTHNKIISDFYRSCEPHRMEILRKSLNAIDVVRPANAQSSESEEAERSMLKYNQAVILFHSRKYRAALDIVSSIFGLNEPLGMLHFFCLFLIAWLSLIIRYCCCCRGVFRAQGLYDTARDTSDTGKARYRDAAGAFCGKSVYFTAGFLKISAGRTGTEPEARGSDQV